MKLTELRRTQGARLLDKVRKSGERDKEVERLVNAALDLPVPYPDKAMTLGQAIAEEFVSPELCQSGGGLKDFRGIPLARLGVLGALYRCAEATLDGAATTKKNALLTDLSVQLGLYVYCLEMYATHGKHADTVISDKEGYRAAQYVRTMMDDILDVMDKAHDRSRTSFQTRSVGLAI